MSIKDEAQAAASSAPVGIFGIDDITIIATVIELAFKLWQACSSASSAGDAVQAVSMANTNELNYRMARHRMQRAANRKHVHINDIDAATKHCLHHVASASSETLNVCCAEPITEFDLEDT